MQSTARVTSVLALAAAARALSCLCHRAPILFLPRRHGRTAPARSRKAAAVAAAGLAFVFWPAASFAAEDLEIDEGLAATQAFLSSISKSGNVKKGSGRAAVPVGDSEPAGLRARRAEENGARDSRRRLLAHEEGLGC